MPHEMSHNFIFTITYKIFPSEALAEKIAFILEIFLKKNPTEIQIQIIAYAKNPSFSHKNSFMVIKRYKYFISRYSQRIFCLDIACNPKVILSDRKFVYFFPL